MNTSILITIIISLIGVLIVSYDIWFYRNYDMEEDDEGFHLKEKDKKP